MAVSVLSRIHQETAKARSEIREAGQKALERAPETIQVGPVRGTVRAGAAKRAVEKWEQEQLAKVSQWEQEQTTKVAQAEREAVAAPSRVTYTGDLSQEEKRIAEDYGIDEVNRRRRQAAEKEAVKETREKNIQLASGEWVAKEDFKEMPPEEQKRLRELGLRGYNRYVETKQAEYEKFQAAHVEVSEGQYLPKADWAKLTDSQKKEVKATGTYTVTTQLSSREQFKSDLTSGRIPVGSTFSKATQEGYEYQLPPGEAVKAARIYEVETPTGKVEIPAKEWEKKNVFERLTVSLGRTPTLTETQAGLGGPMPEREGFDIFGREFNVYDIPILGGIVSGFQLGTEYIRPGIQSPQEQWHKQWTSEAQRQYYLGTYGGVPSVTSMVVEPMIPGVRAISPDVSFRDIGGMEWVQTGVSAGVAVFPFARLGWNRLVTPKIIGVPTPQMSLRTLVTGVKAQVPIVVQRGKTLLYSTSGKPLITIPKVSVRTPVARAAEGFYKQPIKVQAPVRIGIARGLQRAGVSKELEQTAFAAGRAATRLDALRATVSKTTLPSARMSSRLQKAQQTVLRADEKFLDVLGRSALTSRQLRLVERVSGVRGLKQTVGDLTASARSLRKAEVSLGRMKTGSVAYSKTLAEVAKARTGLDTARTAAGGVLSPRFTYAAVPVGIVLPSQLTLNELLEGSMALFTKKEVTIEKMWAGKVMSEGKLSRWSYGEEFPFMSPKWLKAHPEYKLGEIWKTDTRRSLTPLRPGETVSPARAALDPYWVVTVKDPFTYTGLRMGELGGAIKPFSTPQAGERFLGGVKTPLSLEQGIPLSRGAGLSSLRTMGPSAPIGSISSALQQEMGMVGRVLSVTKAASVKARISTPTSLRVSTVSAVSALRPVSVLGVSIVVPASLQQAAAALAPATLKTIMPVTAKGLTVLDIVTQVVPDIKIRPIVVQKPLVTSSAVQLMGTGIAPTPISTPSPLVKGFPMPQILPFTTTKPLITTKKATRLSPAQMVQTTTSLQAATITRMQNMVAVSPLVRGQVSQVVAPATATALKSATATAVRTGVTVGTRIGTGKGPTPIKPIKPIKPIFPLVPPPFPDGGPAKVLEGLPLVASRRQGFVTRDYYTDTEDVKARSRYTQEGSGVPYGSLKVWGDPPKGIEIHEDMGQVDVFMDIDARKIRFEGDGEFTDVGKRHPSTTKGMSVVTKKRTNSLRVSI